MWAITFYSQGREVLNYWKSRLVMRAGHLWDEWGLSQGVGVQSLYHGSK